MPQNPSNNEHNIPSFGDFVKEQMRPPLAEYERLKQENINLTTEVTRLREALEVPTLKPIESITDEDSIQVAEICFPKKSNPTKRIVRRCCHLIRVSIMGGSRFEMWLAIQLSNGDVYQSSGAGKNAVSNLSQVYEFLQSKGYDLPKYVDNSPKP